MPISVHVAAAGAELPSGKCSAVQRRSLVTLLLLLLLLLLQGDLPRAGTSVKGLGQTGAG